MLPFQVLLQWFQVLHISGCVTKKLILAHECGWLKMNVAGSQLNYNPSFRSQTQHPANIFRPCNCWYIRSEDKRKWCRSSPRPKPLGFQWSTKMLSGKPVAFGPPQTPISKAVNYKAECLRLAFQAVAILPSHCRKSSQGPCYGKLSNMCPTQT